MKFKDIIKNKIEIPLIQRDYVQGLEEKKAKKFLEAIKEGIENDGLNLDFIYGNRKNYKFIPIDGQQRLTTLFLLYFYLSLEKEYIKNLQNFSYAIRPTSKEFFKAITKEENWKELKKENITEQIENSNWYFLSWKNDLTVKSALNMLKLIEKMFKDFSISDLDKVEFEFLDLDEYSLNEDLYIKMNARGKQLSNFENFKAEFEKYINDLTIMAKLDNEWLDIFWNLDFEKVDDLFYNFFYNTTFCFYAEKNDIEINFLKQKELLDFYEEVYKNKENINRVVNLLSNLKKYPNEKLKEFCEKKEITYFTRFEFYIWSLGILKDFDDIQMQKWQRIALNLVKNTRIEDIKLFYQAIRELKKLSKTINNNVYKEIDFSNIQIFSKKQLEEEELKRDLIIQNNKWEGELIKAENHWYLDGQIRFLLDFANKEFNEFIKYKEKFFELFNDTVKEDKKSQTLIQRALLTISDYLPKHDWRKKTFCSFETRLRIKQENWRQVFDKKYFKDLLDRIDNFDDLNKLIDNYTFRFDDWKSYFINPKKDWSVLEDTKNYQIVFENEENIYLNSGNTTPEKWGWRNVKELYTWYIFKNFFKLKPRENRKVWWRKEADLDENEFGIVYYFNTTFSSGEVGIWIEKNDKVFKIYKDKYDKNLLILDYQKEKDIKNLSIKDILEKKIDILDEIREL